MTIPNKFNPFGLRRTKNRMPTEGLIFYASLSSLSSKAETGQELNYILASDVSTVDNIKCIEYYIDNNAHTNIYSNDVTNMPTGNASFTMSIWFYVKSSYTNKRFTFSIGRSGTNYNSAYMCITGNNRVQFGTWGSDSVTSTTIQYNTWNNMILKKDGSVFYMYLNGKNIGTLNRSLSINYGGIFIGTWLKDYEFFNGGYLAAARIYNRSLTDDEIYLLATEFDVKYEITANNQGYTFSPVNSSSVNIVYSSLGVVNNFEIISGSLPSNISFNTSTGTFTGIATTDGDHTYDLVIKLSGPNVIPKNINFTVSTRATSILTAPSPQTFNFITESEEVILVEETDEGESVGVSRVEGTFPSQVVTRYVGNDVGIRSLGTQTANESTTAVIALSTMLHPDPVYVNCNINVTLNQITASNQSLTFYTTQGETSKKINYTSQKIITPVYNIVGSLPSGVTFNSSTGEFTSDGTQTANETQTIQMTIASSTGCSSPATFNIELQVNTGDMPIPTDYVMYHSLTGNITTPEVGGSFSIVGTSPVSASIDNIDCAYFAGNGGIKQTGQSYWTQNNPVITLSIWAKCLNTNNAGALCTGVWIYRKDTFEIMKETDWKLVGCGDELHAPNVDITKWHHILGIVDTVNKVKKLYIDNQLINTTSFSSSWSVENNVAIGGNFNGSRNIPRDSWFNGYLAGARIYNRALNQYEIEALSKEFTPIPTSGMVFYAPFSNASATTDETGNYTLTNVNMTSTVKDGIPCLYSSGRTGDSYIQMNAKAQDFGNTATWSLWFNCDNHIISFCSYATYFIGGYRVDIIPDSNAIALTMQGDSTGREWVYNVDLSTGVWHHFAISYDIGNLLKMYLDGVNIYDGNTSYSPYSNNNMCWIGGFTYDTWQVTKYIAGARIYNRVLTADEIALLAAEFTPTT